MSLVLASGFPTTELPGKPEICIFKYKLIELHGHSILECRGLSVRVTHCSLDSVMSCGRHGVKWGGTSQQGRVYKWLVYW